MIRAQHQLSRADMAIDLGTANTLVVERGSGVVFDQPSICCFRAYDAVPEFVAAGAQAHGLVGRVGKPFKIVRPLSNGVLSDMASARALLRFATGDQRRGWRFGRPRALIGTPADATEAERRALITAAMDAGLAEPVLIDEPLLAAIGIGIAIDEPRGRMIVDCGAGTTEVVVISLGRICVAQSVRGGGDALDRALVDHLHIQHRFDIGIATAERLKLDLVALLEHGETDRSLEIRGFDTAMGVPKILAVRASELAGIWDRYADSVVTAVRAALERTQPELCQDVLEDGITITGGAGTTRLLASRLAESTGIPTHLAEAPLRSVATGLATLLNERA